MTDARPYWNAALKNYGATDWIDRPTIFVEQAVKFFPHGGKVLELAAGQGQDSRYLEKQGFAVTCTDFSDYGLQEAERKAKAENATIAFQKLDTSERLPFPDNAFDVVYSHLGLHYFNKRDTRALFAEIQRVLKPCGVFAALFNTVDDPEIKTEAFEKIEDDYYHEKPTGLFKRYFSVASAKESIRGLFEPVLIDQEGLAYKDGKKKLVRIIAKAEK